MKWSGASTGDIEANILEAVEPEVRFLDSVDRVTSYATEGVGRVIVEYTAGTDMQSALSEAEAALQQITILPEDSERPIVRRIVRYDTIMRLVLSGPYSEAVLKRQAKRMRDDLLAAGIDRVTFFGARDEEILVEIEPRVLRQLDLTRRRWPAASKPATGIFHREALKARWKSSCGASVCTPRRAIWEASRSGRSMTARRSSCAISRRFRRRSTSRRPSGCETASRRSSCTCSGLRPPMRSKSGGSWTATSPRRAATFRRNCVSSSTTPRPI